MKVSFVIVNYNGKEHLKKCLDSIVSQNYPKNNFEIIVVDNNSPDKSWKIAKKYKKVRLIRCEKNHGFAGGNNIGIAESSGEFVALVNNDATVERAWTKKMVAVIESDKKIGIAGCRIVYPDNRLWFGGGKIYFPGFARHIELKDKGEVDYVAFAAVIFRKSIFDRYLDERMFMYGEDSEMCKRARLKGYKVVYYPDASAVHYIKEGRTSANEEYHIQRNRPYYYTKYYRISGKIFYLIGDLVIFFPLFSLYRILKNPDRIRFLGSMWRARVDSVGLMLK